jgi:hypothetical protein
MRPGLVLTALAACGRVGFDAGPSRDGGLATELDAGADGPPGCPNVAERCNGIDDDCDAMVDEGVCDTDCATEQHGGVTYQFCPTPRSWGGARAECESRGLVLARIDSATQNQLVYDRARVLTSATDALWLGGTDVDMEGRWAWTDGTVFWDSGASFAYVNWGAGEPSNNDSVEHCMHMLLQGSRASRWNDGRCFVLRQYGCRSP